MYSASIHGEEAGGDSIHYSYLIRYYIVIARVLKNFFLQLSFLLLTEYIFLFPKRMKTGREYSHHHTSITPANPNPNPNPTAA
jgi:hypothetical protein